MDAHNTEAWLKKAEAAMNDAAPGIVASVDGLLEQRVAIMRAGLSAMLKAALDDALTSAVATGDIDAEAAAKARRIMGFAE